jgi:hypothetical protein
MCERQLAERVTSRVVANVEFGRQVQGFRPAALTRQTLGQANSVSTAASVWRPMAGIDVLSSPVR